VWAPDDTGDNLTSTVITLITVSLYTKLSNVWVPGDPGDKLTSTVITLMLYFI